MDNRNEIRQFLSTRRARLTPAQAGLPNFGGVRRVPGLRREEVALMAGMSVEYYTRVERGSLAGVSDAVLEAISRALKLNEAEREHLFNLARAAGPATRTRRQPAQSIHESVQRILDGLSGIPAFVRNGRLDIIAINDLGRALYSEAFADPIRPVNFARFAFLNPRSGSLYPDWDQAADTAVAMLHTEAGRNPFDKALTDLIGELSTRSEEFRPRWAQHNVRLHQSGTKTFRHHIVGDLEVHYDALELPAAPGGTRPDHDDLQRRGRLPVRGWPSAARQLGRDPGKQGTRQPGPRSRTTATRRGEVPARSAGTGGRSRPPLR